MLRLPLPSQPPQERTRRRRQLQVLEEPSIWHELWDPEYRRWLLRACVYEFVGTFILIYIQAASGESLIRVGTPAFANDALGHGLAAFIAVYITYHVSGAILNPALAVGLWFTRRLDALTVALFVIVESAASIAAAGLLRASIQSLTQGVGVPRLINGVTRAQGVLIMSVLGVFLLWMFAFAFLRGRYFYYKNRYHFHGDSPVYPAHAGLIAFAWNAGVEAAFVNTVGSGPNPVRWLGPAIITGRYNNWPVWISGPFIGVLIGVVLYGIDVQVLRPDRSRIDGTHRRRALVRQKDRQGTRSYRAPDPPLTVPDIITELEGTPYES